MIWTQSDMLSSLRPRQDDDTCLRPTSETKERKHSQFGSLETVRALIAKINILSAPISLLKPPKKKREDNDELRL